MGRPLGVATGRGRRHDAPVAEELGAVISHLVAGNEARPEYTSHGAS